MFQWYPTSSNRVPLNRQGHVARMFLVCQMAVFEPFCTWTVHCTLEFRRRMVQPSAQRCDRHQNRSGYFPPLPLPMKPVGPELQLVGGRPSRVIVLEQRWMLIYFIYYESWENPVGLDSWCYEEAGATTQPSILSAGWSHAISVPCSNNRLRLRCITCADAHVRLPLLPGCCDHGITRWIVGSKNSWRMLEVTAAKLLQLKSIEVQYRCWDTIIFYSQMKCFFVFFFDFSMYSWTDRVYFWCFIVQFPRSLKSTASAVLVHYTWDARSTTQRPCKRSGNWAANFVYQKHGHVMTFYGSSGESSVHGYPNFDQYSAWWFTKVWKSAGVPFDLLILIV